MTDDYTIKYKYLVFGGGMTADSGAKGILAAGLKKERFFKVPLLDMVENYCSQLVG